MSTLTISQRIIMHLDRFKIIGTADDFNVPWELTQDGIATSLRISRAHASIELKKLRQTGKVDEQQTHIKGGKVRRKSYTLTSSGQLDVSVIEEFAQKNNIDIDSLLDIKRQDPTILLSELCPADRRALGCACAFRLPVPVSILPPTKVFVIPSGPDGRTSINEYARKNIIDAATDDEKVDWFSFALDKWWEDEDKNEIGDMDERLEEVLYTLVAKGAFIDACKWVSDHRYELVLNSNDDIFESLSGITRIYEKKAADVLSVIIEVMLELGYTSGLMERISALRTYDPQLAEYYMACRHLSKGELSEAESIVSDVMEDTPYSNIVLAKIRMKEGKVDEAERILNSITGISGEEYESIGFERFRLLADICIQRKRKGDALHYLQKAKASFSNPRIRKQIDVYIQRNELKT